MRFLRYLTLLVPTLIMLTTLSCNYTKQDLENPENSVVSKNGQLRIQGTQVVNEVGDTIALHGMSLFWSQWMGKYYNENSIQWLASDWECDVVRAAIGVEKGGYLKRPLREMKKARKVIEASIQSGIYVIVDWHSHVAENHTREAIEFFTEIATDYGEYPNIIYEIYNEPLDVSWDTVLKPYAEDVISVIRNIDPDNIIIVGTPNWSQDVDVASENPLEGDNLAYAVHFYAATHKQWLRDKCDTAMKNGIALWVSEFGTCFANGDSTIDYVEMERWFEYMDAHKLSWCNWSVADKDETASALEPGSARRGQWEETDLTESGKYIREVIKKQDFYN